MKKGIHIQETISWREYPAWLTAFQEPIPKELTTPLQIAAFEAENK